MPRKARMFGGPQAPEYKDAPEVNYEGFPSWGPESEEGRFLQVLMTNIAEPTFYESQSQQVEQAKQAHQTMLDKDAEFYAKALVWARTRGFMRLQPVYGLALLSTADTEMFHRIFPKIIRTPNDIKDLVAFCKVGGVRQGLGRTVKRAVGNWLNGMSQYHAIKYGGGTDQFGLRNVLRMVRPIPTNENQSAIFRYIVHGELPEEHELDQILALEELKALAKEFEEWEKARASPEAEAAKAQEGAEVA